MRPSGVMDRIRVISSGSSVNAWVSSVFTHVGATALTLHTKRSPFHRKSTGEIHDRTLAGVI